MTKFKVTIEYDGTNFVGWQKQNNGPSIQQSLEQALEAFSGEKIEVVGAGRTDSGVHALSMVAHIDLKTDKFLSLIHISEPTRRRGSRMPSSA